MAMAKVLCNAGLGIFLPTKVGLTGHRFPPRSLKFNLNHARHSRLFNQFHGHTSLLAKPQLKGFGNLRGVSAMGEMGVAQHNESLAQQVEVDVDMVVPATECHVEKAVKALRDGKVIAVPTDTLYGLACDACSPAAVQRIYEIKGRSMTSPLAVCISDVMDFDRFAITSHLPDGPLQVLLPGPVTLVLNRGQESLLEKSLNPGLDTIGIRIPECDFIRMVAHDFGSAIALTSANQVDNQVLCVSKNLSSCGNIVLIFLMEVNFQLDVQAQQS
uniref:Threonylcarbamoyl-AMP synthase n=1 Tax=Wollemia nobilis TaxID=56998 RepID=A0A0C9QWQ6_9CONI